MTLREYGAWPGWCVTAGWTEERGGHWYCSLTRFDGDWEDDFSPETPEKDLNPASIDDWLRGWAKKYPEVAPPPGFILHLWDDRGSLGPRPVIKYSR